MTSITIAERAIGPGHPCWVVAELSGNHHGDYGTALRLIEAAKDAGADAVKIQAYDATSMTMDSEAELFQIKEGTWAGCSLWDLYLEGALPWEWLPVLKREADALGVILFPSLFSLQDLPKLACIDPPAYKVASFELGDTNLIRGLARLGKPLILSTGMATKQEILAAIKAADQGIADRIRLPENRVLASPAALALLRCTSAYPAPASDANLRMLEQMRHDFRYSRGDTSMEAYPVGLSDHTLGIAVPVAAVALGACIVEKHLTLSRADGGPDAKFSLEPAEFKAMVEAVRTAEAALGQAYYGPTEAEQPNLRFRRSLWVVADVRQGEQFTPASVRSLRPADGLPPAEWDNVIGRRAAQDCKAGEPLDWGMVES